MERMAPLPIRKGLEDRVSPLHERQRYKEDGYEVMNEFDEENWGRIVVQRSSDYWKRSYD